MIPWTYGLPTVTTLESLFVLPAAQRFYGITRFAGLGLEMGMGGM